MATRVNKKKQGVISIVVIALLVVLYLLIGKNERVDRREKDFRHNEIELTDHAKCRMDCRHITKKEIEEVLDYGKINYSKSDKKAKPCAKYALEYFVDGKAVRVVVGDCNNKAVIITVIDLDHDFECHCPGDDN